MSKFRIVALAMLLPIAVAETHADEQVTTAMDRTGLTLTVYQGNLTLIHEERRIAVNRDITSLAVTDIPPAIIPESVSASSSPSDKLRVTGQVFETGVLTPEALLGAAVGKSVQIVHTSTLSGEETLVSADVLRAQGREALVRTEDGIRSVTTDRIVFDSLPPGLRSKPTLVLDLATDGTTAPGHLTLRYLTSGLNWRTDYVAELNESETAIRLTGWVSLTNNSGIPFRDATLRLVSGSLNRAGGDRNRGVSKALMMRAEAMAPAPSQSVVSDLHIFDFDHSVSVSGKETRQLALLPATEVPVEKEYRLEGNGGQFNRPVNGLQRNNPSIRFHIRNTVADGLGRGLPGGAMRFYATDKGGSLLLGENNIGYTPPGEKVTVTVGRAIDITSERRQTDFRRDGLPKNVMETAHAIVLRNGSPRDVSVTVVENIPGDWTMLSESQSHTKESAGQAAWDVAIPAGGKTELTYRVRTRF